MPRVRTGRRGAARATGRLHAPPGRGRALPVGRPGHVHPDRGGRRIGDRALSTVSNVRTARVTLPDGCPLHVERRGSGPPVLLLHAGAEDVTGWARQADALASAGYEAIGYDRRGTGRSGRTGWPGDGAPGHARDAVALLAALDLAEVIVLGVSSGAMVALELALRAPESVVRAHVHEPPAFRHVGSGMDEFERLDGAVRRALAAAPGDHAGAYAALMEAVNGEGFVERMDPARWAMEARNAEAFVRDDLPLIALRLFSGEELVRLAPLVRLTAGAQSPPFLRDAADALRASGGWACRVLPGQGHTPHLSEPGVFAGLLAGEDR
ncbi:alpha/beta hydrolase [Actinomadura decatromicini]|uniref:Alpha/beta hydrolase n=1 Tax=Actinomadura decatromicini TaxID=2604572 RepID=A0A5D3FY30_9ACTN|nr:alpha/beta hydrolase [Actinomadura decatromicini]